MSYIGNQPFNTAFKIDTFSGDGVTVVYSLSLPPASAGSILVTINGILQDTTVYGITGAILTFSSPPPIGTNNISVRYLGLPASNVTTTAYRTVTDITATAGQTTFVTSGYTPGFVDVYRNGVKLAATNFTATNGIQIVLTTPTVAGDNIQTVSFFVSSVLNAIPNISGGVSVANLDVAGASGTGAMLAPTGTTAQRPSSPTIGMTRWNTTLGATEVFVRSNVWQPVVGNSISALIVAGGGGTSNAISGGGGGGGVIYQPEIFVSVGTSYTITVGAGGPATTNGANSTAFGFTAIGGGQGGPGYAGNGSSGGSGGGGSRSNSGGGTVFYGGAGTGGQGYPGGQGSNVGGTDNYGSGGGGGGGGGQGGPGIGNVAGQGGPGFGSSISGTATYYAGGGGGGAYNGYGGPGGVGGGGTGTGVQAAGGNGTANTGGGAGAPGYSSGAGGAGATGGSGIVIISYPGPQRGSGGVISSVGGNTIHTFTSSGTYIA